jgi:hypothetical protein
MEENSARTITSRNGVYTKSRTLPDVLFFYALDSRFHPEVYLRTRTDALGNFSLQRVEAAKFILAAQPANSELVFFPGTRDASEAQVIDIHDSTPVSGLTIRIP